MSELSEAWQKSSKSGPNCDNCVEARYSDGVVQVRDTKVSKIHGDEAPVMELGAADWEGMLDDEKQNRSLSTAALGNIAFVRVLSDGNVFAQVPNQGDTGYAWAHSGQKEAILEFTESEIIAWGDGVVAHEFQVPSSEQFAEAQLATESLHAVVGSH